MAARFDGRWIRIGHGVTMTILKLKRSTTPGMKPPSLESGEIAINEADGILFSAKTDGSIRETPLDGTIDDAVLTQRIDQAVANLVGGAPGAFDTLKELYDLASSNATAQQALQTAIANKADIAALNEKANQSDLTALQNQVYSMSSSGGLPNVVQRHSLARASYGSMKDYHIAALDASINIAAGSKVLVSGHISYYCQSGGRLQLQRNGVIVGHDPSITGRWQCIALIPYCPVTNQMSVTSFSFLDTPDQAGMVTYSLHGYFLSTFYLNSSVYDRTNYVRAPSSLTLMEVA